MQTDIGIDFANIDEEAISIDNDKKMITIRLPDPEIYNSSLIGDIEVETSSLIFKKLFDSDNDKDYNLALAQLEKQTNENISKNDEILDTSKPQAIELLNYIFKDTGYSITLYQPEVKD